MSGRERTSKRASLGAGALVGVFGSIISKISREFLNTPLGYSPMSFKSTLQVVAVSGISTVGVVWGIDEYKDWKSKKGSGN